MQQYLEMNIALLQCGSATLGKGIALLQCGPATFHSGNAEKGKCCFRSCGYAGGNRFFLYGGYGKPAS